MAAFVYLLRCSDGSFYVGSTRDLDERVHEHVGEAFGREKQVQGWGRAKREALIRQAYDELPVLARKRFRRAGVLRTSRYSTGGERQRTRIETLLAAGSRDSHGSTVSV